eukprot:scaffold625_cov420-Prasinococcus_capsulatus_cf.AAC.61
MAVKQEAVSKVLGFLKKENRPYNAQVGLRFHASLAMIADAFQKFGIKKTAIERALAELATQGKVVCKEYGKAKVYLAEQEGLATLSSEEIAQLDAENTELKAKLSTLGSEVAAKKRQLQTIRSAPGEELPGLVDKLREETRSLEQKLQASTTSASVVSQEELQKILMRYGLAGPAAFVRALSLIFWLQRSYTH